MIFETILRHLLHMYVTPTRAPTLLATLAQIARAHPHPHPTPPNHTLSMRAIASPILQGRLYLSGIAAAENAGTLADLGITHVLSILTPGEVPVLPARIRHLVVPLADTTTSALLPHLPTIVAFISAALANDGNRVLVHCVEGVSRSASAVVAYLMAERGMDYTTALRVVRRRRGIVAPNAGFVRQLEDWGAVCEERRRARPREWEQVLRSRKGKPNPCPAPPVKVEKKEGVVDSGKRLLHGGLELLYGWKQLIATGFGLFWTIKRWLEWGLGQRDGYVVA